MKRNDYYISKIISACLLGDGFILKDDSGGRNRNGQFRLRMMLDHIDHVQYIGDVLSLVTNIKYDYSEPRNNLVICGHASRSNGHVLLRTQNHPIYTEQRSRWYLDGVKRIDPHACTLLDWELLAIWYQQDGYINAPRKDCINQGITLCTDCFSYGDLNMIRIALIEKLGLSFNIRHRSYNKLGERTYRLELFRKQTPLFLESIQRFIQPSFQYKLLQKEHPERDDDIVCSS